MRGRSMRKRLGWLIGLLLTLSMVVVFEGPGSGWVSRSAAPSGAPIKVGVICSCSGPFGTYIGAAGKVADAWAKSVNASGGINGHPVDITILDDASTPGTSVTRAQSLIDDGVHVILDATCADTSEAHTS